MSIAAAAAAASSFSLEGISCSTSNGITSTWIKNPSFDAHRAPDFPAIRNPFFGSTKFNWLSTGRDLCLSKVSVAADYSDSVPDSSNYVNNRGYHPLEELKFHKRVRDTKLTSAEIARTTAEANNSSLLVFPGTVHCEPHEQISWAEFQYVIDDYGGPLSSLGNLYWCYTAFIGMDIPKYDNQRVAAGAGYNYSDFVTSDDIPLDEDYFEVVDSEVSDGSVDWGMPDTSSWVHPIYFSKCLTKAVNMEYDRKMDHPSNGLSIVGYLRPAFADEESYLRRQFHSEDSDGDNSDWQDGETPNFSSKNGRSNTGSTLYRLEIMRIELFSVYGIRSPVSLQDFQDAEPDILVHSTSAIIEHFSLKGIRCNGALKALCKKKGLNVEEANLIGVDSLGMDVRVFSGVEATSEVAAEKQIQQLLFPRSRRKKLRSQRDVLKELDCF
ncbi:pentatricopeptide repeat (PPR) superfamily protein [Citrus sinensis]|uniref:Pentatricopeptide repeat (PPR) superfamily protein n=1 Tax=Citrus sinensis TaxID=2711 RepID=A0ACB8ME30_CITSI|nr:pentatricopeptide repeat (PPR) superfamily protein [Citrus sinensis]